MKKIISLVTALLLLLSVNAVADLRAPQQLIKSTSDNVLDILEKNKAVYEKDPDQIYTLVNDVILPHLDFKAMSKLALGKH